MYFLEIAHPFPDYNKNNPYCNPVGGVHNSFPPRLAP